MTGVEIEGRGADIARGWMRCEGVRSAGISLARCASLRSETGLGVGGGGGGAYLMNTKRGAHGRSGSGIAEALLSTSCDVPGLRR